MAAQRRGGSEPRDRFSLTTEDVVRIQQILGLSQDGVLSAETARAMQGYRDSPDWGRLDASSRTLLRRASAEWTALQSLQSKALPPHSVWIFYAGSAAAEADWVAELEPGQTIFWYHGRVPKAGANSLRIRRADTVLLMIEQEIVATGVLLADHSRRFVDRLGRYRRPVRIIEVHRPPFSRGAIEQEIGGRLVRQGSVHPTREPALSVINAMRAERSLSPLPLDSINLNGALLERPLEQDLAEEAPYILPDARTAAEMRWTGPAWEGDGPSPELIAEESSARSGAGEAKDFSAAFGAAEAASSSAGGPAAEEEAEEEEEEEEDDPSPLDIDARIPFVLDAPADSEDELDRGPFALFLAQRLHLIWCQLNGQAPDGEHLKTRSLPPDSDTFIAHVDSPWGGGKTTFANFVARVLDPRMEKLSPRHFLRSSLAPTASDEELPNIPLRDVFVPPWAKADPFRFADARRPWIVARYNAWRDQYVQPPWWQVFLTIHREIAREVRRDALADLRAAWDDPPRIEPAFAGFARWIGVIWERFAYQIWNSKLKTQLIVWGFVLLLGLGVWAFGAIDAVLEASLSKPKAGDTGGPTLDPKRVSDWIALGVAALAVGGASISTLITIVGQSLAPDLDFTAEHKQIGVEDPINRFRRSFNRILKATPRPALLIVDDLDRCEPKTVVEIMRGFQTIIRSPRLFVLLLGDRAWIENAHDVHHKDLSTLNVKEGEGGLGARFVQKVIQLSFRLPTMAPAARERLAQRILGETPREARAQLAQALREADAKLSPAVETSGSVREREAGVARVVDEVTQDLARSLPREQQAEAAELVQRLATARMVAAAGSDAAQQRSVFNAVTQLVGSLPNNPRQIKRIFMAFAVYEVVGRAYFRYQLTSEGPDGERRAQRWRQLAIWVTLAIEWPETWRAIARRPDLLTAAYASPARQKTAERHLLAEMPAVEHPQAKETLRRLRADRTLSALLSQRKDEPAGGAFAGTALEAEAVYEFNCIIWEPGFPTNQEDPP